MSDRDFKKNRSDSYQWLLLETPCSPEMLAECADSRGITAMLNPYYYNEELFELQDKLREELWRIIDTQLTTRQREVLHLWNDGYTQIEIAEKLKVNQSSITKSIHGNCDYSKSKTIYGGSLRKLKKISSLDPEIQKILKRISEIIENMY